MTPLGYFFIYMQPKFRSAQRLLTCYFFHRRIIALTEVIFCSQKKTTYYFKITTAVSEEKPHELQRLTVSTEERRAQGNNLSIRLD